MTILKLLVSPLADVSITNEHIHAHDPIEEKLSSIAEAILNGSWVQLNVLSHELRDFKPSQKCLNTFGREQMMETVVRDPSMIELGIVRDKLLLLGASEEAVDEGFQQGLSRIEGRKKVAQGTVAPAGLRRMLVAGVYTKRSGEPRLRLV